MLKAILIKIVALIQILHVNLIYFKPRNKISTTKISTKAKTITLHNRHKAPATQLF